MLTDREIIQLYREWSEKKAAAGFLILPSDGSLPKGFLWWLKRHMTPVWTHYERELIARWRKYEGGDK